MPRHEWMDTAALRDWERRLVLGDPGDERPSGRRPYRLPHEEADARLRVKLAAAMELRERVLGAARKARR